MTGLSSRSGRREDGRIAAGAGTSIGTKRPGWSSLFGIALAVAAASARADFIPQSGAAQPTAAIEVDESTRRIPEVDRAIKSFEKREFDACLEQLAKAVKAHPELPPAHALFAKLAFLANQGGLIRPALERGATEDPDHPEVYILFGNVALLEGRVTDASVQFEKATALSAATRWTPAQRGRFERFCQQGNAVVAEARADWKAAQTALAAWLKLEPANARARQRLGRALFSLGEHDQAYNELERAAKEDSTLEPAAVSVGWLYTKAGNVKKAGEWMNYAVKQSPNSLAVRRALAAWLLDQGRADEAQTQAEAAAKIDPKSNEIKRILGLTARERREWGRAEQIFQALTLESPGDAWVRNQLALVLAEQSDEAKQRRALELAELSVRQNPNAVDALSTLGTVYYRLHRLEEAEKVLQAVVGSGKGNSDAAYILAHVRADRGHPETAPDLLKMALNAPGPFMSRKDAQDWLDRLTKTSK